MVELHVILIKLSRPSLLSPPSPHSWSSPSPPHLLLLCYLDGSNLLGHDRQHFNVDPVELIKAGPSSSAGKAFEELAHSHEVQLIGTVEYHTLDSHGFGKILHGRGEVGEREKESSQLVH